MLLLPKMAPILAVLLQALGQAGRTLMELRKVNSCFTPPYTRVIIVLHSSSTVGFLLQWYHIPACLMIITSTGKRSHGCANLLLKADRTPRNFSYIFHDSSDSTDCRSTSLLQKGRVE